MDAASVSLSWSCSVLLIGWLLPLLAAAGARALRIGPLRASHATLVQPGGWGALVGGPDPGRLPPMSFTPGRPVLVLLVVALVSWVVVAFRPAPERATLDYWIFAEAHRHELTPILDGFARDHGITYDLDLVAGGALGSRLESLFMSQAKGPQVPDLVNLEIHQVGRFFRPPVEGMGMLDLTPFFETRGERRIDSIVDPGRMGWSARHADGSIYVHDGSRWRRDATRTRADTWKDRLIPARFTPWMKSGRIMGAPQDVHPMTITYREDLFRAAGVDLAACRTWPEFHHACLTMQEHWRAQGVQPRHAMELFAASCDLLQLMLLQRRVNLVEADGRVRLADPLVAETLAFYAPLVAGPRRIGVDAGLNIAVELDAGSIGACFTPDWRIFYLRHHAPRKADGTPRMQGHLRMMPLPRFADGDAPTSTWGGTCTIIPKTCPNPELAFAAIERAFYSRAGLDARLAINSMLPPLPELWDHPLLHQEDPLYGGQRINELFIALAAHLPERVMTPATSLAMEALTQVQAQAVAHVRRHGADGLESACRAWLQAAEGDLLRRIERLGLASPEVRKSGSPDRDDPR
jgi:arabinosaccharide transport system substrate-binding protein